MEHSLILFLQLNYAQKTNQLCEPSFMMVSEDKINAKDIWRLFCLLCDQLRENFKHVEENIGLDIDKHHFYSMIWKNLIVEVQPVLPYFLLNPTILLWLATILTQYIHNLANRYFACSRWSRSSFDHRWQD